MKKIIGCLKNIDIEVKRFPKTLDLPSISSRIMNKEHFEALLQLADVVYTNINIDPFGNNVPREVTFEYNSDKFKKHLDRLLSATVKSGEQSGMSEPHEMFSFDISLTNKDDVDDINNLIFDNRLLVTGANDKKGYSITAREFSVKDKK